jgi:Flp pilus assembly protein TadD
MFALAGMLAWAAGVQAQDVPAIERLFRAGDTAQAVERAQRAIAAKPREPEMRFLLGVMLAELRRESEATEIFVKLTEEFPDLPEPYNNLAVLRAAEGRIDQARELLEAALLHDPSYPAARENLGDVFVRLALRAYERASQSGRGDSNLERKLRLTRELLRAGP